MLVPPKLVLTYRPSNLLKISLNKIYAMNEKLNMQDLIDLLTYKYNIPKKNVELFVKEFLI